MMEIKRYSFWIWQKVFSSGWEVILQIYLPISGSVDLTFGLVQADKMTERIQILGQRRDISHKM